MADIIDRLTAYAVDTSGPGEPAFHPPICDEAVAEIKRLREHIEALADAKLGQILNG